LIQLQYVVINILAIFKKDIHVIGKNWFTTFVDFNANLVNEKKTTLTFNSISIIIYFHGRISKQFLQAIFFIIARLASNMTL